MFSIENSNNKIIFDDKTYYLLNYDLGNSTAVMSTSNYLGQNDVFINNSHLEPRTILLKGAICSESNIEEAKKGLINMINPLQNLIFRNGKYSIECRATQTIKINYEEILYNYIPFSIELYCPDPYWTDTEQSKAEIALWEGKFLFPLAIQNKGVVMGIKQPSLIVNIDNPGDVKTGMIIEFRARGALSNPSLFNVNTREYIKIKKDMVAGEVIKINTNFNKKKIESILNGVTTNILNHIDLGGGDTFLQLDTGDNLFRYDADTNLNNLDIDVYFSPKYLEV